MQMDQVVNLINRFYGPVILTGDLNVSPPHHLLDYLMNKTGLVSAHDLLHPEPTEETGKLDYIFYKGLGLVSSSVINDWETSDHRPILAEFSL